jgi:hypothetical protein
VQVIIQSNEVFQYNAELHPVAAIAGRFNLAFSSTFSGARDPAPRVAFQTTLDRVGLLALRGLVDSVIGELAETDRHDRVLATQGLQGSNATGPAEA